MKTQRKRLSAILISAVLTLSNFAGILPQSSVLAAEESVQTEMVQVEPASSEAQQEPAQESAPAEKDQQQKPAQVSAPAEKDQQQKPASAEEAQPAPASSEATQPTPAPVEEPAAAAPAESVSTPEPAAAETSVTPQQESVAPAESQSAQNSTDTQQSASNGKLTEKEGQTGEKDETVTADHAAAATKMVTVEYIAGNGGAVDRDSETVDVLSADAALLGSTATAQEGYQFVDWTASDDSIVSSNASFVPALSADMPEKTVYIANFKKTDTMPAQDFEGSVSGVQVSVHADGGRFPEGTTMHLATVSKASILNNDSVQDAVGEDKEVVDAIAVDITFLNKDGKEIEPAGTISVNMSTSRDVGGESHQVLHIDDSGNASQVTDASADGASFEASEFSIYVIAGSDENQTPAIATYIFHDAEGNEISGSTQKVKDGETVYAPTTPEKSGSKFLGWSYNNGNALQEGDPGDVNQITASVTETRDVDLYPVFQQAYYVFFLDDQGRVSTTKEGVSGDTISVENVKIPLDSTHSVTGWYTEPEQTNKVDSVTLSDHNVTLYPKVEEGHYLYFSSGDGASYVKPVFVAAGKETVNPIDPKDMTRPGYTFKYWSEKEKGSEYTFGSTITKDLTLYAVWEAEDSQYTVIYWWENANDDHYSYHENSSAAGKTGSKIDLEKLEKQYDGFTLNKDKTNTVNQNTTIAGDGSTIVNIYYSRNIYEIKYYQCVPEKEYKKVKKRFGRYWRWVYEWVITGWNWEEMPDLRIIAKYGANIADNWPSKKANTADNWPSNWGTKKGKEGGEMPCQSGISTMPLNGDEFYYFTQKGKATVSLMYYVEDLNGRYILDHTDSYKTPNSWRWWTTAEDHYDIEGFTYTNNVKDGTDFNKVSKNALEISFKYSRNSYSIKFVNGSLETSETFKYGADISNVDLKTAPERPEGVPSDFIFAGWYDNELGAGDPAVLTGTMPAHNITLYAKWIAPTYKGMIHTTMNGIEEPIQMKVDYGDTIHEDSMPTVMGADGCVIQKGSDSNPVNIPKGYIWAGWTTRSGNDYTIYNFGTKVYSDITLYPYYINGEKHTVRYQSGDGIGKVPTDSKQYADGSYANVQSASEIKPPAGKTFLYWSEGNNGQVYYPGDKVKITNDLVLTAVYGETSPAASITYHSSYPADSGLMEETSTVDGMANNTVVTLEKAGFAAPDGYYFAYWKDVSGRQYANGTKVGIDNISANNLYAVWEKKKEITLTANSGEFTYDGTQHTVSGVVTDQFTIDGVTYIVSGYTTDNPVKTDAGTYPNTISGTFVVKTGDVDVTDHFTIHTVNGKLTINKRKVTLTSADATKEYDGKALKAPDNTQDNTPKDSSDTTPAVKTGDNSMIQLYGWLALFAAVAIAGCFMELRKRRTR